jgi:light-regulated signal transduction histidine kinase (bacteriophytochrome)
VIANEELAFQNKEKEKRAAELLIANEELAFQNEEKEKRAAELAIANKELAFQNQEKENRAEELLIANKELAFQNGEKEKRASELLLANIELADQYAAVRANIALRKQAEAEVRFLNEHLERLVKERTEDLESFSYSVSHDLRAPIRAVSGYTRMFKSKYGSQLDQEGSRLVNNIADNATKMGQLIDDLLAFSRLSRRDMKLIEISMHEIVTSICKELQKEQPDRKIEFKIRELLPVKADNTGIKQVWLNLISNAIKYSRLKEKSIIEIGSEMKEGEIIYYVKDNGAGFDMRYVNKLFNIFQRLHSDDEFEGTGIGLAIVQRIIQKHGGTVRAESEINNGAIFQFSLKK